jgi:YD repeat-containing protein
VLRETTNAAGQTVRQVRDTTGRTLEYTVDSAGRVVGSRVVSGATGSAAPRP